VSSYIPHKTSKFFPEAVIQVVVNGEIVGLDQEWVLVTPAGARVVRPAE